jgi:hypothetical protein
MRATRICAALNLMILLGATSARAQDLVCPTEIPTASSERRARAKEWFSRAETAEAANDPITAVKAYQCSLRMVPHASTAFNLARLAERTGDLELAVESYQNYLTLSPEATDRETVSAKVAALSERLAELRRAQQPLPPPPPVPPDIVPTDPVPPPPPGNGPIDSESPPGLNDTRRAPHPGVYVLGGVAVGAAIGGVILNLGARNKMDECRKLAREGQPQAASTACDAARPRAYTSYVLFALAAGAAVGDAVWLLVNARPPETHVSVAPLPDGAAVTARLRF